MQIDEDNGVTAAPDKALSEAGRYMAALNKRATELQATGLSYRVAFDTAELESRIDTPWPKQWGNDLHVLIYGDFAPPDHDLDYPALGITVEASQRTNTVIKTALCVLNARVKVREKSLSTVLDAAARLNTFLGIWTIMNWGRDGIGWWCELTHGLVGSGFQPFEKEGIEDALAGLEALPPKVKRKVRAALYWIREPKKMMWEKVKTDILHLYAGYWDAFECLVDAVCLIQPQPRMTKREKQDGITRFIADRQGRLDAASLRECYRLFGDPSFAAKASHALRVCCPDLADGYINECFRAKPKEEQLYMVRNAIDHGAVDSDSLQEISRVQEKYWRLHTIVFVMLACFIPIRYPGDPGSR
jgi:hypothetical protein